MKKIFLVLFVFLCIALCNTTWATGTRTVNNIPLEDIDFGNIKGIRALHFTGYTFDTTEVYNESGGTLTTDGMVDVGKYPIKSLGIRLTNISGGGTLTVKINEFIGTTTFPFTAATVTIATTSSHTTLPITEYCEFISVSASASAGTITGDIIGNYAMGE